MSIPFIAAFACYALGAIISIAFGVNYLLRSEFMPYHREAVGLDWQQLDPRMQALLTGLMRVAAGGMLAEGLSMLIMLQIPFRAGEIWAQYAIPTIGLVGALPTLYATLLIRRRTGAHTPVLAGAAGIALVVAGFILTRI
jgi:hypothetical protein